MEDPRKTYYSKRGQVLVKNLRSRHFEAYYCADRSSALQKALELIPKGASVGWGGAMSAEEIGLIDAVRSGGYHAIDRDKGATPEELDGQMVNIDGNGNRMAAIVYGPESVIVVAGMNKVMDSLEDAVTRARTVAAPMNKQRFGAVTGCAETGVCVNCKSEGCICNQILITRHCLPAGRIKFILVGEALGL